MFCPNCGETVPKGEKVCGKCGTFITYDFGHKSNSNMYQGYSQNYNPNVNQGYSQNYNPNVNQGYNPNYNPNVNQGYNPNYNPNANQGYNPNYNPNVNRGYNPNYNPNVNQGYNPNYNPNVNRGYNPNVNQGYDDVNSKDCTASGIVFLIISLVGSFILLIMMMNGVSPYEYFVKILPKSWKAKIVGKIVGYVLSFVFGFSIFGIGVMERKWAEDGEENKHIIGKGLLIAAKIIGALNIVVAIWLSIK